MVLATMLLVISSMGIWLLWSSHLSHHFAADYSTRLDEQWPFKKPPKRHSTIPSRKITMAYFTALLKTELSTAEDPVAACARIVLALLDELHAVAPEAFNADD